MPSTDPDIPPLVNAASNVVTLPVKACPRLATLDPPLPPLLGPVVPGTITFIRGARGVGKSWLALAMAHAITGGTSFLGWAARQAPALYVEAAMSEAAMGQRLRALGAASDALLVCCSDRLPLAPEAPVPGGLAPGSLLVLDGLSLLVPPGRGSRLRWQRLCAWLRARRDAGYALVLVDHSRRAAIEDLADTVLVLKPRDTDDGVAFAIKFTSRFAFARRDEGCAVTLALPETGAQWRLGAGKDDPLLRAVAAQAALGWPVRGAAEALGLTPTTYWRRLREATALGLVADKRRETDETEATRAVLAQVSNGDLLHILWDRDRDRRSGPRPGPAALAAVPDSVLFREYARRYPDDNWSWERLSRLEATPQTA